MKRKFRVGLYFDLYSSDRNDWSAEYAFNASLSPEFLEVMLEYPPTLSEMDVAATAALRACLQSAAVTVHAPTINLTLCSLNPNLVRACQGELNATLTVALALKASSITFHAGEYPYFLPNNRTTAAAEFARNARDFVTQATACGLEVLIENLKGKNIFPTAYVEIDAALAAHERLFLAFDIRHFMMSGIDPFEALARYRGRMRSVHYRRDCGLDESQVRSFLRQLVRNEYSGTFIIEDPALNAPDKTGKAMLLESYAQIASYLGELEGESA